MIISESLRKDTRATHITVLFLSLLAISVASLGGPPAAAAAHAVPLATDSELAPYNGALNNFPTSSKIIMFQVRKFALYERTHSGSQI